MLRGLRTVFACAFALVAGLWAGGSFAGQTGLRFSGVSLFDAFKRIPKQERENVIFLNRDNTVKTFELPPGAPETTVRVVAKQYGKDAVALGKVWALPDALPESGSAKDRLKALSDWVYSETTNDQTPRGKDGWMDPTERLRGYLNDAQQAAGKDAVGQFGQGQFDYTTLSEDQRGTVQNLILTVQEGKEMARLADILGAMYYFGNGKGK